MNASSVTSLWLVGINDFGISVLVILGALLVVMVGLIVFYWGYHKMHSGFGLSDLDWEYTPEMESLEGRAIGIYSGKAWNANDDDFERIGNNSYAHYQAMMRHKGKISRDQWDEIIADA